MSTKGEGDLTEEQLDVFLGMARDRDRITADRTSPLWGLFLIMESMAHELRRRRDWEKQAPEFDGTDGADPAWWRGQDDGVKGVVRIWKNALAGHELKGAFGDGDLTDLYRQTLALVDKIK